MSLNALPSVTIIVLNWNAAPFLANCLTSLYAQDYPNFQIVVVDNASTDNSLQLLKEQFPDLRLIENLTNDGFSAGNNRALRHLTSDIAVLANPDIVAAADWLRQLITPLLTDSTIGIAGCKVFYPDGRLQHVGGILLPPQAIANYRGWLETDIGQYDHLYEADYVIGAALAIRRTLLEQIGEMDEGYFLYYEEADWCIRAKRAGYRVVVVPASHLTHIESATTPKNNPIYFQRMHSSRWRYLLKHYSPEMLLQETMPAEHNWLTQRDSIERLAAAHAYWHTLHTLPHILTSRTTHGNLPLTLNQQVQLRQALYTLWQQAHTPDLRLLHTLQNRAILSEPIFVSTFPLLGKLIATFRTHWNNIATRWYLRPILQQQSRYNQLLTQQLHHQQQRLHQQAEELLLLQQAIAEYKAKTHSV